MSETIYQGYLVYFSDDKDRFNKCIKINRGDTKGFRYATDYIKDLERQLAEAREAIKEHKKRKKSWGFEGSDYDKVLWEQLKEQG